MLRTVATTAVCAAALAATHWDVAVRLSAEAPASDARPRVSAKGAVNHAYNHVLGLASPQTYDLDPVHRYSAFEGDMPVTDLFQRPVASLFVVVPQGGAVSALTGAAHFLAEDDAVAETLANSAMHRDGLAPASLEVVSSAFTGAGVSGLGLSWTHEMGFVTATAADAAASGAKRVDADLVGMLACTTTGEGVLTGDLGLGMMALGAGVGSGSCPSYTLPAAADGSRGAVVLDAGAPAARQALSEAALLVVLAKHTVDGNVAIRSRASLEQEATGPTLHRVAVEGVEAVARSFGAGSPQHAAVASVVQAAIARADAILRAGLPHDRVATLVFSSYAAPHSEAEAAVAHPAADAAAAAGKRHAFVPPAGRFLQSNGTGTTTTTTTTTSLNDVAAYQVALWTAILLGGVLLFTLYAMLNIEGDKRDPQLYAQLVDAGSSAAHHRRS